MGKKTRDAKDAKRSEKWTTTGGALREECLSPMLVLIGMVVLYFAVKADSALAASNLGDAAQALKSEATNFSRYATGTAATAGFGLMSLGAGRTGQTLALTGVIGSAGYLLWPTLERTLQAVTSGGR